MGPLGSSSNRVRPVLQISSCCLAMTGFWPGLRAPCPVETVCCVEAAKGCTSSHEWARGGVCTVAGRAVLCDCWFPGSNHVVQIAALLHSSASFLLVNWKCKSTNSIWLRADFFFTSNRFYKMLQADPSLNPQNCSQSVFLKNIQTYLKFVCGLCLQLSSPLLFFFHHDTESVTAVLLTQSREEGILLVALY